VGWGTNSPTLYLSPTLKKKVIKPWLTPFGNLLLLMDLEIMVKFSPMMCQDQTRNLTTMLFNHRACSLAMEWIITWSYFFMIGASMLSFMSIMNFIRGLMLIPFPYSLFSLLGFDLHGTIFYKTHSKSSNSYGVMAMFTLGL
jgi:hypothetical protein